MFRRFAARLLMAPFAVLAAYGQTPSSAPATEPVEFVHAYISVDVKADGTFTQTLDQLLQVKTQQGVQAATTAIVLYS